MRAVDIATNLRTVYDHVADAARDAGRDPEDITVVAVGKNHPVAGMERALQAGHRVFGENRVQEAQGKWPALRERWPDVSLHLIGPLQGNKVKDAVALFDVIETVDRPRIAERLAAAMTETGRRPRCLVQVNTGHEAQKAGILPEEADVFLDWARKEKRLPVEGVMAIPPLDEEPSPHFAFLEDLAQRHRLPMVSMGMSGDYEIAVRFGATHVRVGTAIFGERPYSGT